MNLAKMDIRMLMALKQTDILRFPWDEEEKKDTSVTDEEMQRLRAKAKEVESQLNTHKDV